ncbi:hypothetical protein TNCV_2703381 [Trichonephila clavipes]|nr:hypothetical protein TNCV_2703381 [Trichonephila clavipes]
MKRDKETVSKENGTGVYLGIQNTDASITQFSGKFKLLLGFFHGLPVPLNLSPIDILQAVETPNTTVFLSKRHGSSWSRFVEAAF